MNGIPEALRDKIERVLVPSNVKIIATSTFKNCTALSEVRFEEGDAPLAIGLMAFEGCKALTSIHLPARTSEIGHACFRNCDSLASFSIGSGEKSFVLPLNVFDGCAGKEVMLGVLNAECVRRVDIQAQIAKKDVERTRKRNAEVTEESSMEFGDYRLYPRISGNERMTLPECIPNGTLIVCVDKTWTVKFPDPTTHERVSLEDCARGYWCVAQLQRAKVAACKFLLALSRKKVEGIWKIDTQAGWKKPEELPKPTWPSDKGPWKSPREGALFLPDDDEIIKLRQDLRGKTLDVNFDQWQAVIGVFEKNQANL